MAGVVVAVKEVLPEAPGKESPSRLYSLCVPSASSRSTYWWDEVLFTRLLLHT